MMMTLFPPRGNNFGSDDLILIPVMIHIVHNPTPTTFEHDIITLLFLSSILRNINVISLACVKH